MDKKVHYQTADGEKFYQVQDARNHAKSLKDKSVTPVAADGSGEVPETAEETPGTNAKSDDLQINPVVNPSEATAALMEEMKLKAGHTSEGETGNASDINVNGADVVTGTAGTAAPAAPQASAEPAKAIQPKVAKTAPKTAAKTTAATGKKTTAQGEKKAAAASTQKPVK